ncbi:DUF3558 domain-containing protein [soil metagenome]
MAVAAGMAVTGCSHTVDGTAERSELQAEESGRNFGYIDNSCGRLADSTVRDTIDAEEIVRPYSGAVCQYVLSRQGTTIDATFSWFDTGTLERERAVAQARGAQISETMVLRYPTFLARTSSTGISCAATTSANPGVLSWWVQYRDELDGDPCVEAKELLAATLNSEM